MTKPAQQTDVLSVERMVQRFHAWRDVGYDDCYYEDLIDVVIDECGLDIEAARLDEARFYGMRALREKYMEYDRRALWNGKTWSNDEIVGLYDFVSCVLCERKLLGDRSRPLSSCADDVPSQFRAWQEFRSMSLDENVPGVYLLAMFSDTAPSVVDPISESVIYIGQSDNSIRDRLSSFRHMALTGKALSGRAHSAAWTYRTEFVPVDWSYLSSLRVLFVSWMRVKTRRSKEARRLEGELIDAFVTRHRRRPFLNKQR